VNQDRSINGAFSPEDVAGILVFVLPSSESFDNADSGTREFMGNARSKSDLTSERAVGQQEISVLCQRDASARQWRGANAMVRGPLEKPPREKDTVQTSDLAPDRDAKAGCCE
jgi:hypothetical protein